MTTELMLSYIDFTLPPSVVSRIDVSHLVRDAERADNALTTATVRSKANVTDSVQVTLSDQLTEFLSLNQLSLDDGRTRSEIIKQRRHLGHNFY